MKEATMRIGLAALLLWLAATAFGAAPMYDEAADARADIRAAVADASSAGKRVLVVFGANWCGDCKVLDASFRESGSAPLIAKNFKVVKVNVGRFDRNTDLAASYGVPLKQGIPAVAVLSAQGKVLYVTKDGELADAHRMGDKGIHDFFAKVAAKAR
jgi:protein disulfide-isomerase